MFSYTTGVKVSKFAAHSTHSDFTGKPFWFHKCVCTPGVRKLVAFAKISNCGYSYKRPLTTFTCSQNEWVSAYAV